VSTTNSFESVHERFRPRVLRYLSRLVGAAEAEDLTQLVMLKVSAGLQGFRGDSSVSTWIYRIATNAALDRLRRKADPPLSGTQAESGDSDIPTPSVENTAIRGEMNACIREFVERLPESYKTVIALSELEGFSNAEIASILDISLDTVKIRLHRARDKLRRELQGGCTFHRDEGAELACDRKPPAPVKFRPRS
jgi:RNA polymerase sigma-70 factor (ECF subfamily)